MPARDPRNTRPRDSLGRPLPYGSTDGQPALPTATTAAQALTEAERLLAAGYPFTAHEVLEEQWKRAPSTEADLWRALAQLAVGVTHAARGNPRGAGALLTRAAAGLAPYVSRPPHGIAVADLHDWARSAAPLAAAGSALPERPALTTPPGPRPGGE